MEVWQEPGRFSLRAGCAARSSGVHVSGIIRDIARMLGKIKDGEGDLDDMILDSGPVQKGDCGTFVRVALGMAWEDWISRHLPDMIRGVELELDGIYGTLDGLVETPEGSVVHEFKVTWKSSKQEIEKQWLWITQVKAYCYMAMTTEAVLHVLWVNGDYQGGGPAYEDYRLVFGVEELESVWRMLRNRRDKVKPEGPKGSDSPESQSGCGRK